MGTLLGIITCTLLVGMASIGIPARTKPTRQTMTMTFTTKVMPTFPPEVKEDQWMSPPRQEHKSKYIESVIYEPLPQIVLSRSTYKITSFIEFAPYIESFKKFELFLNRFTRDLDNPDFVGPLYNINRTKSEAWDGPKSEYFRVQAKCLQMQTH